MGAASVTTANNHFLDGFFEPTLRVQFGTGANFRTKAILDSGFRHTRPHYGRFPHAWNADDGSLRERGTRSRHLPQDLRQGHRNRDQRPWNLWQI